VYNSINTIYFSFLGFPIWVWSGTLITFGTFGLLLLAAAWDIVRKKPVKTIKNGDLTIELWVRERKMPSPGEAIIVPVAPDLKMAVGIAKWVRDATADDIQRDALAVAPLPPGEAFVGRGGKFRFGLTALAVVMDNNKIPTPAWISDAVSRAIREARQMGAGTILLPDFTEDLLRQPQTITDEQRRESCRPIARAMLEGVIQSGDTMETIRVWVWRKGYEDIYAEEMARIADADINADHAHASA
jgi:hypothetical protein